MTQDLVLQEHFNDVLLKIRQDEGPCWRMPAHTPLLARSKLLLELIEERSEEKPVCLLIRDMKPETAVAVLKYIYENEYPTEVTADLLLAAQKYELTSLEDNISERLSEDLTLSQACQIYQDLEQRQPCSCLNAHIKNMCLKMMEDHALTLFGSDMVMSLRKQTLASLLESDRLNVPDEAFLFWGIWRWGRKESSMNDRSLKDEEVARYIHDLLCLIRKNSVKNSVGIPLPALEKFGRCKTCRCFYVCPADILNHATLLRPSPSWEDTVPARLSEEESTVCIQLSVEKDVLLVGLYLEMCLLDREELVCFVRIFREPENKELRRQRVCCMPTSPRKLGPKKEPEIRLESQVTLNEPLFLSPRYLYSLELKGNFKTCQFLWGSFSKRRMKIGNTFVSFRGEGVIAIRELYIIPDVSKTWGPRGPEA